MSRSYWKGPYIENALIRKTVGYKIWSRASVIPSQLIGKTVFIYNGKIFKRILIDREKVGFKFGEFCFTRTYTPRVKNKKEIIKKKK